MKQRLAFACVTLFALGSVAAAVPAERVIFKVRPRVLRDVECDPGSSCYLEWTINNGRYSTNCARQGCSDACALYYEYNYGNQQEGWGCGCNGTAPMGCKGWVDTSSGTAYCSPTTWQCTSPKTCSTWGLIPNWWCCACGLFS